MTPGCVVSSGSDAGMIHWWEFYWQEPVPADDRSGWCHVKEAVEIAINAIAKAKLGGGIHGVIFSIGDPRSNPMPRWVRVGWNDRGQPRVTFTVYGDVATCIHNVDELRSHMRGLSNLLGL